MKSGRGFFVIACFLMTAVIVFAYFAGNAEAFREGREFEGPRGGEAVEGPRGNVAVEGPRGNIAIGTRYNVLPDSARSVVVGDQTYYVDDSGVYYLPCDDNDAVYCVVAAPQ